MIRLDKRLQAAADEVMPCKVLADIGSDHGKIAVYAALYGLAEKVIASDISASSASKSLRLAAAENADVDVRVGDGASTLNDGEYDTVVIAGMGGIEIARIIQNAAQIFKRYILVPHSKPEILRKYFIKGGLTALADKKIKCGGRFYDVITAEKGDYNAGAREILFGKLDGSKDCAEFIGFEKKRLNALIEQADTKKREEIALRLELLNG